MKKILLISALSSLLISCSIDREDVKNSIGNEINSTENKSKNKIDDTAESNNRLILCKKELENDNKIKHKFINGYPEIERSTYFSMNDKRLDWFFRELDNDVPKYLSKKYYNGNYTAIPYYVNDLNTSPPSNWNFSYDYTHSDYISRGENDNYALNSEITPQQGSYLQFRILSSADNFVQYCLHYFTVRVRPVAVVYYKELTMCGDYKGLGFTIYYEIY